MSCLINYPHNDKYANFWIYGKLERVKILEVLPFGTYDVQRLSDGKCFRVTGMSALVN